MVFYNANFAKFAGIDRTEWLGRSDDEVFPKEIAAKYKDQDLRVMGTDQTLEFSTRRVILRVCFTGFGRSSLSIRT